MHMEMVAKSPAGVWPLISKYRPCPFDGGIYLVLGRGGSAFNELNHPEFKTPGASARSVPGSGSNLTIKHSASFGRVTGILSTGHRHGRAATHRKLIQPSSNAERECGTGAGALGKAAGQAKAGAQALAKGMNVKPGRLLTGPKPNEDLRRRCAMT
jgi:hypothetical protein